MISAQAEPREASKIVGLLKEHSFRFTDEIELQDGIAKALSPVTGVTREARLSGADRIDFLVLGHAGSVGIEVKIDGPANEVLRQLLRYAEHPEISELILVTSKIQHVMAMPQSLGGKPLSAVLISNAQPASESGTAGTPGNGKVSMADAEFVIEAAPHVMLRLKRVFEQIWKGNHRSARLSDTPGNARELAWFLDRYPMTISPKVKKHLRKRAEEHLRHEKAIAEMMAPNYVPSPGVELAVPLRAYQAIPVDLVRRAGRLLLCDDLGVGKTAVGIGVIAEPDARPALVVTMTHLTRQWEREIKRFAPSLRIHVLKKGTPYPLGKNGDFPDVVITNYHKLNGWAETLAPLIRSIVFDEAQELRHSESLRYSAAKHLVGNCVRRLGLTATPVYNRGVEVANILDLLAPGALGSRSEFLREWCGYRENVTEPRAFGQYLRSQGLMLRRTRADVGRELPEAQWIDHEVDSDPGAIQAIEGRAAELAKIILAKSGTGFQKMEASAELDWRLRQATGIAKAPYVAEFVRLLIESGESKILLFGWHRAVYDLWAKQLAEFTPVFFTGEESERQKEASRAAFVDGDSKILIMSLRSGAGLDGLQAVCRTAVFGELDWSPSVHEQGGGRIHRDGQKDPVALYRLISSEGSDPIIADVLRIKDRQIIGIRDTAAALVERSQNGGEHLKKLAEAILAREERAA